MLDPAYLFPQRVTSKSELCVPIQPIKDVSLDVGLGESQLISSNSFVDTYPATVNENGQELRQSIAHDDRDRIDSTYGERQPSVPILLSLFAVSACRRPTLHHAVS
jgi:hypothetical protein